ncbi:imelysin family protein [Marinobacter sp. F3R08]|uniref:imelysin family protein n=1 Tax=Marinobacter sp. F3R08 TaxID=2841559 RepID=UPI001C08A822|nr:imelysin family protein [Marinobacter sp. F3R08]MBU2953897.1 imelysin family protein [Marinobacter sp. F3R08]
MQPITRFLCISTLAATSSLTLASTADTEARQQWHEAIAGGYQALTVETRELSDAARNYCQAPTEKSRTLVESAWLDAFVAWQRVRFVDFGPIETDNLAWQFQFWPDPKNLVARKAGYLLDNDSTITPSVIRESGVAVQGFPMMEYLLFDQEMNTGNNSLPAPHTCELLTNVALHAATNSQTLTDQWSAFKAHYIENELYRDTTIRAGMAALEILEERRLARPMGLSGNGKRNPYITDAWRSGKSLATVEATVIGLQQLYLPGLTLLLESKEETGLANRIRNQFAEVQDNFPGARMPMTAALEADDQYRTLQGLYVDISQLTSLVNDEAAVAIGVVRGFNSSDGD